MTFSREVKVQSKTWHRDSHGLFDFESTTVVRNQMNILGSCNQKRLLTRSALLYRDKDDNVLHLPPKSSLTVKEDDKVASLIFSQGRYYVYHASELDLRFPNKQLDTVLHKDELTHVLKDLCKKVY